MPRARNVVDTVKLQLSTTSQVVAALEALVKTGKFGKSASEAGEELLRVKLREIELEGWLDSSVTGRTR
jgi:Arc/MetJ-type ribon-helix-helix transcriptional regulator